MNILMDSQGYIKLIDYGQSRLLDKGRTTRVGKQEFMAPEMLSEKVYTYSVDWWALGVLVYQLMVGFSPFVTGYDGWEQSVQEQKVLFPDENSDIKMSE